MGRVLVPDSDPVLPNEAPRSTDVQKLCEPQSAVTYAVPLDNVEGRDHDTTATTAITAAAAVVVEQESTPATCPPPPPPPMRLTLKQHMEALVRKNAEEELDEESPALPEILNSKTTSKRFVFNTFTEVRGEEQDEEKTPTYYRLYALRKVKYPLGKRLGSSWRNRDGTMWGATLADFYDVKPWTDSSSTPISCQSGIFVTSSMLYARFNSIVTNEERYEQVRQIMRVAETEGQPRIVPVYSIERLIRDGEAWIASEYGASWVQPTRPGSIVKDKKRERWEVPESWPPKSVFDPSAYPSPWPLEPFKTYLWQPRERIRTFVHKPKLQEYIPEHLLPKTLIVHDPWKLLDGYKCTEDRTIPWIEKDDITRVYNLDENKDIRYYQDQAESIFKEAKEKTVRNMFLANPHSSMEMPDGMVYQPHQPTPENSRLCLAKPPVFIVFPPKSTKVAPSTAHLYISPAEAMGEGHHSFVYRAEFEIPRFMVVENVMCKECVCNDVKRILEDEDGPNGERRDPRWDERTGSFVLREQLKPPRKVLIESTEYEWDSGSQTTDWVYKGPYRAIQTRVGWQNLDRASYCEHLRQDGIHPLTSKVQVTAKLSKKYDDHLEKEGANYKAFPKHFFEHRTGFNLVTEILSHPTPCGAVVPQFYGYYKPDQGDERNRDNGRSQYLSPILLVEECGVPIVPEELSVDERNECISLMLRMHAAGWSQYSIFRRNIVRQHGPLSEHPVIRRENGRRNQKGLGKQQSFRVIDFGRAGREKDLGSRVFAQNEANDVQKLEAWFRYDSLE